jgi:O-methyltransferase
MTRAKPLQVARRVLARSLRRPLRALGYDLTRVRSRWPRDFEQADIDLCELVEPYTMTSPEAILALAGAVRHVVANGIEGAIVECGVWRGGSMLAVARTLLELDRSDVDLYLFDTFSGMTEPTEKDVHWTGATAASQLEAEGRSDDSHLWAQAGVEQVRQTLALVPYPESRLHFVEGKVENTIPERAPERIALLRLDTDWYESTKHELVHLYPRLEPGGALIIDDYGWWRGAREATDEYFGDHGPAPLLMRVDADGVRLAVKP